MEERTSASLLTSTKYVFPKTNFFQLQPHSLTCNLFWLNTISSEHFPVSVGVAEGIGVDKILKLFSYKKCPIAQLGKCT